MTSSKEFWSSFAFYHLAMLTESGMPLHEAFNIVAEDVENRRISGLLRECGLKSNAGVALWEIKAFQKLLPDGVAGLFEIAGTSKEVSDSLKQCGDWIQESLDLRLWLGREKIYPGWLFVLIIVSILTLGSLISGPFTHMLTSLSGIEMPLFTRIMFTFVDYAWPVMIVSLILIGLLMISCVANYTPFAYLRWRLPFIGWKSRARFIQILLMYLKIGFVRKTPVREIFNRMQTSCTDAMWRNQCEHVVHSLDAGDNPKDAVRTIQADEYDFSRFLLSSHATPDRFIPQTIAQISNVLHRRYAVYSSALYTIIQITVIVLVGSLVMAAYLPLFKLIAMLAD